MTVEKSRAGRQADNDLIVKSGRRKLGSVYVASIGVALLLALVSVIGLVYSDETYPTEVLQQFGLPNDIVSLFVGLPLLVGSMWFAWRGELVGLLFWPGALMYVLYSDLAYIFAMPLSWIYLAYLVIGATSLYTLIGLVASVDARFVRQRLAQRVPERLSGGVLVALGVFVFVRVFAVIGSALAKGVAPLTTDLAVLLSDLLLSPAWIIGGVLLWKREAFGYLAGLGLLFQASMLFVGLIMIMIVQPWLTDAPFVPLDLIVVASMGLICFVPLALFLSGTMSTKPG